MPHLLAVLQLALRHCRVIESDHVLWGDKLPLDGYVAIAVIVCSGIVASRRLNSSG